jgi:hypothetical protein
MSNWREFCTAAPDLAALVQASFGEGRHKTMASLRADGSPRISGTEVQFIGDEMWLGSMPGSLKAADLVRDPRVAIHSPSPDPAADDPTNWVGDAKVAGFAVSVGEGVERDAYMAGLRELMPEFPDESMEPIDLFRIDVREAVATRVGEPADHLVIEMWHEGRGLRSVRR